jgi:hypothetical protein
MFNGEKYNRLVPSSKIEEYAASSWLAAMDGEEIGSIGSVWLRRAVYTLTYIWEVHYFERKS